MSNEKYKKLQEFLHLLNGEESLDFSSDEDTGPAPVYWETIDAMKFPDDRWLVKDILPKEGITILASISGEGKSMVIMHLAKCLAEGLPWFGHEEFKANESRVLYINLEMSESEMQRRGRLIGFNPNNTNLFILNRDDFNLNRVGDEDRDYKWLLEYIFEKEIDVLIIDTFRPATGGLKEDKAEEVRAFFKKFQVLKNSGVSIIFTEHLRKPNQMEGRIPRKEQLLGSQDKTANVEILLMLRRDEVTGEIHIYQRKNRLGNEAKPFAVKMVDVVDSNGEKKLDFEHVGQIEDDINKKAHAKVRIMEILSSTETKTTKDILQLLQSEIGQKNLRQALKELSYQKEITLTKIGKQNAYSLPREDTEIPQECNFNNESDIFSDS